MLFLARLSMTSRLPGLLDQGNLGYNGREMIECGCSAEPRKVPLSIQP